MYALQYVFIMKISIYCCLCRVSSATGLLSFGGCRSSISIPACHPRAPSSILQCAKIGLSGAWQKTPMKKHLCMSCGHDLRVGNTISGRFCPLFQHILKITDVDRLRLLFQQASSWRIDFLCRNATTCSTLFVDRRDYAVSK